MKIQLFARYMVYREGKRIPVLIADNLEAIRSWGGSIANQDDVYVEVDIYGYIAGHGKYSSHFACSLSEIMEMED